jgi:hypothetical protein
MEKFNDEGNKDQNYDFGKKISMKPVKMNG